MAKGRPKTEQYWLLCFSASLSFNIAVSNTKNQSSRWSNQYSTLISILIINNFGERRTMNAQRHFLFAYINPLFLAHSFIIPTNMRNAFIVFLLGDWISLKFRHPVPQSSKYVEFQVFAIIYSFVWPFSQELKIFFCKLKVDNLILFLLCWGLNTVSLTHDKHGIHFPPLTHL